MSFRRFPFQFSDVDSFDRMSSRSEESRNMFQETSSSSRRNDWHQNESHSEEPTWRTPPSFRHSSDSIPSSGKNVRTRFHPNWSGDGIPIKVTHEKKSTKKNGSDVSSEYNGSTQENSRASTTQSPREPRVHHIPITVEPRDGSSSGYVSDSGSEKSTDVVKQNQTSDQDSQEKYKRKFPENKANILQHSESMGSHETTKASKPSESFRKPHVHHIPITVEPRAGEIQSPVKSNVTKQHSPLNAFPSHSSNDDQPLEGPVFSSRKTDSASNMEQQKFSAKKNTSKPGNGPHVTKIPINVSSGQPSQSSSSSVNQADIALNEIAKIDNEVAELRKQVDAFSGTNQDKQYRYLDEMLTRCMLKLDNIDTIGMDAIRKSRKLVINKVQECIALLESKILSLKGKTEDRQNKNTGDCSDQLLKGKTKDRKKDNDVCTDELNTVKTDSTNGCAGDSNIVQTHDITVSFDDVKKSIPSLNEEANAHAEKTICRTTDGNEVDASSEIARTNEEEEKMEIDNVEADSTNNGKNNSQQSISEVMEIDKVNESNGSSLGVQESKE